jgi:catechol 2,3-dioxygenase-like lactoylglutathione lyase family enzyme
MMELARPQLDVGLFTNKLEEAQAFYGEKLGLQFESILPVGGGFNQYRYLSNSGVIKVMHSQKPLPARRPGGYLRFIIASPNVTAPQTLLDQDGNTVELVPPGLNGVTQLEVVVGASDPARFDAFYEKAAGAQRLGPGRYKVGETIFSAVKDPAAQPATAASFASTLETVNAMAALGIRYVTLQVRNCDAVFSAMTEGGASEALKPVTVGNVLRVGFVRDPDGNFVEIVQRPPA